MITGAKRKKREVTTSNGVTVISESGYFNSFADLAWQGMFVA